MKTRNLINTLTLAAIFSGGAAQAQNTPVGLWQMLDDESKQPLSLVRISEVPSVFRLPTDDSYAACLS